MSRWIAPFTPAALALVCLAELAALTVHPGRAVVLDRAQAPATPPVPADTLGLEAEFLARMTPDDVARGAAALCRLDPADPLAPTPEQRLALALTAGRGARARAALGEARMAARAKEDALLQSWSRIAALHGAERLRAMGAP